MTSTTRGRAIYAAAAVERMVGVDGETLQEWQQRFGSGQMHEGPGGQRLYSRDDVARLRWVAQELAAGREPEPASPERAERSAQGSAQGSTQGTAQRAGLGSGSWQEGPGVPVEEPSRLLVLIADRDAWSAELAEFFLRTEGFEVEVCQSSAEAIAWAARVAPSVSVVDLGLGLAPGETPGLEICRSLRRGHDHPIVAMSSMHWEQEAIDAGADAFVTKPIDPLVLISTVKDLIGTSAFLRTESRV